MTLPEPGSFPGAILSEASVCVLGVFPFVILSGATACVLGVFPSKNLAHTKPSAHCYNASLSSQTAGSFAIEAQDDVTLPAPGSFPGVILSEAKNLVHTKHSAHCYNSSPLSQTARSFAEKAQDDVRLPAPGSFPGVILSGASACVLGAFPSKNLAHTKHSAHCYNASPLSQTARSFAIEAQDDVRLLAPGSFPGVILSAVTVCMLDAFPFVILSGATACVLGVFPSKNLPNTRPSAHVCGCSVIPNRRILRRKSSG